MRSVFSCSSCAVVLLLSVILGQEVSASHAGKERKDVLHRVAKAQVTARPLLKRDGNEPTCATDHHLCPSSLGGNCCPSRYACAVDSCFATTSGPTTGCGRTGYYPCGAGDAGCCAVGLICADRDCIAPAGVTDLVRSCPNDYFLCPASLNYGCCPNDRGCAVNQCYATEPVTTTVTGAVMATSDGVTIITTTTAVQVSTPTPPTGVATGEERAAKFIPTSVPKVPASTPSSTSNGGSGLSGAAIGGIVAGVVVLLIIVLVAAFFIVRRLNQVVDVVESKKESTTKSRSQALREEYGQHLHPGSPDYTDSRSGDHLMGTSSLNSTAVTPQPGGVVDSRGRSDSNPAGGFTPSPNLYDRYNISPEVHQGYFDHNIASGVQPMQAARMRSSTESSNHGYHQYAYTHQRQYSNASELSDGSDRGNVNSPLVQELDSTGFAELPSAGIHSRSGSRGHMRSRSNSHNNGGGYGSGQIPGLGLTPLDESVEHPESHGFYGRSNQQSGQTGAGLEATWDMNSPTITGERYRDYGQQIQQPGGYSQQDYQGHQQGVYQQQGGYQQQYNGPDDIERPPAPPPK
ncbi:hypothetical protein QBC38DRAFT_362125 [Podospora fimiseda]|uniref:Mid2 domain-containing protein n=1 Tax=Podospora fimiseda TaxID=252190 RepID=A0AAN7BRR8_9PEZI|nr:hypothetical protein QBC38DRAFT_362125 [Podospora fimiseda]